MMSVTGGDPESLAEAKVETLCWQFNNQAFSVAPNCLHYFAHTVRRATCPSGCLRENCGFPFTQRVHPISVSTHSTNDEQTASTQLD